MGLGVGLRCCAMLRSRLRCYLCVICVELWAVEMVSCRVVVRWCGAVWCRLTHLGSHSDLCKRFGLIPYLLQRLGTYTSHTDSMIQNTGEYIILTQLPPPQRHSTQHSRGHCHAIKFKSLVVDARLTFASQ